MNTISWITFLLFLPALFIQCDLNLLEAISSYELTVSEPSGLAFDAARDQLWTMSDRNGDVFCIGIDGKELARLDTDLSDPEGIAFLPGDSLPYVVEEAKSRIMRVKNQEGKTKKLEIEPEGHQKHGWEGMCLDPERDRLLLAREKTPSAIYEFSFPALDLIKIHDIPFIPDISAIDVNPSTGEIWLLSDEAKMLYLLDPEFKAQKSWTHAVLKAEGLAFDWGRGVFYLVSDEQSILYTYAIPK